MSFDTASAPKQPKLLKEKIPAAQSTVLNQDIKSYNLSDSDWSARFPALPFGRDFMIGDAASQLAGDVSPQATQALETAGLGKEAAAIPGGDEFKTARNLGQPILAKEQRDRNFAENLMKQNPPRTFGLSGGDVVNILEANSGNANAFRQAAFGTQTNAFNASQAQQAQDIGALSSIASGLVNDFSKFSSRGGSPYTDPFSYVYSPTPYAFGGQYDTAVPDPSAFYSETGAPPSYDPNTGGD